MHRNIRSIGAMQSEITHPFQPLPSTRPEHTASAAHSARRKKIGDALVFICGALLVSLLIAVFRVARIIHYTTLPGVTMYADLIYVAAIVVLAAITVFLAIGCRRLQDRK